MIAVNPNRFSMFRLRSQLGDMLEYYEALMKRFEYAEWRIKVAQTRVPAKVFKGSIRHPDRNLDDYPDFPTSAGTLRSRSAAGPRTERRFEPHAEIALWEPVLRRVRERGAVVRGGPGSGKSFLTSTTITNAAQSGLREVAEQKVPLDEAHLPIHVNLEKLTKRNTNLTQAALDCLADELCYSACAAEAEASESRS